jgi:hypothetical protein
MLKKLLPFILFMALAIISLPLNPFRGDLTVVGWVYKDDKPIRNAEILVWENDEVISRFKSNIWGRFITDLPLNNTYIISFSAPDLISKKLLFNTHVPEHTPPNDDFYFEFIVELFHPIPWIEKSFFENPLAIIFYDQPEYAFNYIKEEYNIMLAQMEVIKANTAMFEAMGKDYLEKLRLAERFYDAGDFDSAYEQMLLAQELYPGDNFIQEKIKVIEQIIYDEQLAINEENHEVQSTETLAINNNLITDELGSQNETHNETYVSTMLPKGNESTDSCKFHQTNELTKLFSDETIVIKDESAVIDMATSEESLLLSDAISPYRELELPGRVVFMVQILATPKPPKPDFFNKIHESLPDYDLVHYKDEDHLDKYAVGIFSDLDQAMETHRQLRRLNYETYIIAFLDGKRVRVKEALTNL